MEAYLQTFLQQYEHLKIQLEEIKKATNNFDNKNNYIGRGGFGNVYNGTLSHSKGRSMVAIKRLDRTRGQGEPEFLKEITMLHDYKHENVISLLGFCCEGSEMILVYELASRRSLDRYLNSPLLTWRLRLKICLDAATGLRYLHDPRETHRRLIHCDVKSGNILLDDQWNAKVSDLGLAQIGSANEQHSVVVTLAAGSKGYIDPQYLMTHTLTKESDIYSFGVVLFEVLCGKLCYILDSNGRIEKTIVPTWTECYKKNKLSDVIFKDPAIGHPLDQSALEAFSGIAYRCLAQSREHRPTMTEVVTELETSLQIQVFSERQDYEEMAKTAEPPLNYSSNGELWRLLSKGALLNGGKTWFSLNKKGEHCEMISFVECLDSVSSEFESSSWSPKYNSRFPMGVYRYMYADVKTHVETQFLSPGITYTVNLVFKTSFPGRKLGHELISLKYKLQGETKTSVAPLAYEREDGWWMAELYQFTSDHENVDLEILFHGLGVSGFINFIEVEGIEFRPLEKVNHEVSVDEKFDMQSILDSDADANWEEKLPTDYEDILKGSINSVQWTTKKEAYSILREGILFDDGKCFYLDKNGKKCHLIFTSHLSFIYENTADAHLPPSSFGEAQRDFQGFYIDEEINSQLVSSHTTYASYLVYKLPEDLSGFEGPMEVKVNDGNYHTHEEWYIYLVSPQTPVIRPKAGQNTHNPLNKPKIKGLPKQRNDGWMEVQIWEFQSATTTEMNLVLKTYDLSPLKGLIIAGIECKPK